MGLETAAITGLVGAGSNLFSGIMGGRSARRNARAADRQMERQADLQQQQLAMGQEQVSFFRNQYNDWREQFSPILEQLKMEAMEGREPDYAAITADNAMAFDSAQQSNQRQMERFGINPGDGQFGANVQRAGLGRAASEVDARQGARQQNDDAQFSRLGQVYGIGAGLQGQAMSGMAQGTAGLMGALGQQAGTAGHNAQLHGQLAGQGAQAFGNTDWGGILGQAFDSFGGMFGGGGGGQPTGHGSNAGASYGVVNTPSGRLGPTPHPTTQPIYDPAGGG